MSTHPFRVPVATLRRRPGDRRREERLGRIPDLFVTGSRVPQRAEVRVEAQLESVHGGILVTGTVSAPWEGACRRCLEEVSGTLTSEVRELFEEGGDPEQTYRLDGDQLDLEPMARDAVVLELPSAPLCSDGCRGLCPVCGSNRNDFACGCSQDERDPRWARLEVLRGVDAGGPRAR